MALRNFLAILLCLGLSAGQALAAGADTKAEIRASVEVAEARRHNQAGEHAAALAKLEAAALSWPDNADIANERGFALRKLGRLDEALAHYDRALRLDPDRRGAHEYLGELHLQRGDEDLARALLSGLERLCPAGCEERAELEAALRAYEASTAR
jgi:tetratricopeptide (TPR) repeat protein